MDFFPHFAHRLIRGKAYARKANKLKIALAIEDFRTRAKDARDAVKHGDIPLARRLAASCREDWKLIRQWLHA